MHATATSTIIPLPPHQAFRMVPYAATAFESCGGALWITQEGMAGDVILKPGESWLSGTRGAVVVQSLGGPGRLRVEPSAVDGVERTIAARALQSRALGDAIAAARRALSRMATRWMRPA